MRAISRRERILMISVGLGFLALGIDRVWITPDAADAGTLPPGQRPQRTRAATDLALDLPQPSSAPAVPDDIPDVFQRTRLFPEGIPASGGGSESPESGSSLDASQFAQAHRLQGVVLGPRPLAVIDDRTVRIGDRIDGAVLTAIRPKEVELALDGERILLPLAAHR